MNFINFIINNTLNKKYLMISISAILIQFVLFKTLYPYPDFFSDSYSYLFAAYANLDVSIWPIGYSKFLRLFHFVTNSDLALVSFQYFFLEVSALYFYFTILYFYRPSKVSKIILFIFLFFNPLFFYVSNYVNSDPLFIALSLLWFTELLWIIQRPNIYHIISQGILLFACFTVRNNAYIYPLITVVAFSASQLRLIAKVLGTVLGIILIVPFVLHTRNEAYEMTGTKQFSLFTGWQLANNALYMYAHINVDDSKLPSKSCKELDTLTKKLFVQIVKRPDDYLPSFVGNFFIRQPQSPLKQYMSKKYIWKDSYGYIKAWGKSSAIFDTYGSYLIKKYPIAFSQYFVLENMKNYLLPPLEKLEVYNLGETTVDNIAEYWFDYKSNEISSISKTFQGQILFFFPYFFMLLTFYFAGSIIWWAGGRVYRVLDKTTNATILLVIIFFITNFIFTVFATMVVFRYQIFPMIICLSASLIFVEIFEKAREKKYLFDGLLKNKKTAEVSKMI